MKYIKLGIALCMTIAAIPALSLAESNTSRSLFNDIDQLNKIENKLNNSQDSILGNTGDTSLLQIAFRKVDKKDLLGGVSVVNVANLMEKNYSTYSLENLEALTPGFNGSIWGMGDYLVLVDGVPRDANNVMPTEIDQISVLKSASAVALYGSRAAKGVVYITTKRGGEYGQKINVRANAGVYTPISYPKFLGSAEYMTLYNEARRNDGLSDLYNSETIYNHASGLNPYRYPNVDYYSSEYLKESYNRYDATAEISGGNDKAKYYTNFGYQTTGNLLNFGEAVDNNGSNRFNVRGNIDVNLNKIISLNVDASVSFSTQKGVNTDYWAAAATSRPYRFSPLIPIDMIEETDENSWTYINNSSHLINNKYLLGGSQLDQTNAFASIYAGGNTRHINRQFQFNTGVNFDLNGFIEGLSFKSMLAVDYLSIYNQSYNNNYAVYQANWNNYNGIDQISNLIKYGDDAKSGNQNISGSAYRQTMAFSGQFDYQRTFGEDHHVSGMLIATGFQIGESTVYHNTNNVNLGLQLGYNYLNKYYADFSGALPHSAKLPSNKRLAFSPTLSLGWRISEESFLQGSDVIDDLKLTASAGILNTDLDINDYFLYEGFYTYNDAAWYSWRDGELVHTFDKRRGDNNNLTYPKRKEITFGIEGSLYDRLLTFNGSYFFSQMTGNVIQPSMLYPMYFMSYWPVYSDIPYTNYDIDQRSGFDFGVNLNKKINQTFLSLGVTGTFYDSKAIKRDELYEFDYQNRAGRPLDAIWGLQSDGFYSDVNDINNSASSSFGEVKPGDIKYKDQNGDNVIDTRDEVYLGKYGWSGSPFTLGVNFTAKWKNVTLFALATGRFGAQGMKNSSYFWVDGEDKYSVVVRDRWTEETKNTATYPRLTTQGADNNFRTSDFWMYNSDRFDLAKVQISYDFPKSILGDGFIRELGAYVNGFNLLTSAKEKEIMQLNINQSPQTRFFNLGVKALF